MKQEDKTEKPEKRFRLQFDIGYKGKAVEIGGKSVTVPEMNLTVRQLLENHVRGKAVPTKEPIYFETKVPTINDMTDVEEFRNTLKQQLENVDTYINNEKQLKDDEAKRNTDRDKDNKSRNDNGTTQDNVGRTTESNNAKAE